MGLGPSAKAERQSKPSKGAFFFVKLYFASSYISILPKTKSPCHVICKDLGSYGVLDKKQGTPNY